MTCDSCQGPGPTSYAELRHNVGMLVMRQVHTTAGELCRSCLKRAFWRHTFSNVTLGWWGMISFFMTWYFLFANIGEYTRALGELGADAPVPVAAPRMIAEGEAALERLAVFAHNVRLRLRAGEAADEIARDLAATHDVTVSDATAFVRNVRGDA
jgi:hypothetical protein